MPVALDTDVNAAAVGELRWGAGRDVESLCYLTVGTGVGAGLVLGGAPVHGLLHPEAGHLRIPHDRARDPFDGSCPFHGDCWEGLASGHALRARWGADPAGLPDAHPAWDLEAGYIAAGILAIVMIASPQRVIAGGGVMERPGLMGGVRRELTRLLGGYLQRPELTGDLTNFLVAPQLGDDAGVLGAIALAADRLVALAPRRRLTAAAPRPVRTRISGGAEASACSIAVTSSRAEAAVSSTATRADGPRAGAARSMLSVCSAIACTGWSK